MHNDTISVITPVRNEPPELLQKLSVLANLDGILEVIVVDSSEKRLTADELGVDIDSVGAVQLIRSNKAGRAVQMNLGGQHAKGDILWFVHADTSIPRSAAEIIRESVSSARPWGRFDVRFNSRNPLMTVVAASMNTRSAITGICTGDQAIFVDREVFHSLGGYPEIAIMEDIALSKRLKSCGQMIRVRTPVTTSARRWEECGYVRTIVLMWTMRLLYWLGVSPKKLADFYRQVH